MNVNSQSSCPAEETDFLKIPAYPGSDPWSDEVLARHAAAAVQMERKRRMRASAGSERYRFGSLCCLILGVLISDILMFSPGGAGTFAAFSLAECLIFYMYRDHPRHSRNQALLLVLPVMLIAVPFLLFRRSEWVFIPYAAVIILMALQVVLLSGAPSKEIFSPEMVAAVLQRVVARPFANLDLFFASFRVPQEKRNEKSKNLLYVLAGIAVAIPFVTVLLSLFLSADGIYKMNYLALLETLKIELSAVRLIGNLIFGFCIALFCGSVLLLNAVDDPENARRGKNLRINPIAGMTFTVVLNILLASFVAVQARYLLFHDHTHELIEEIGYAEYARQGFFQLSWASAIVFAAAAAVLALTRYRETEKNPIAIRISVLLMCVFNAVVAFSSAARMRFYIDAHGLSIRRVSTLLGILVILVSLFFLAAKCLFFRMKILKTMGVSLLSLVVLFSFINVDRLVARYNTNLYISGVLTLDVEYYNQMTYTVTEELLRLRRAADEAGSPLSENAAQIDTALQIQANQFDGRRLLSATLDDFRVSSLIRDYEAQNIIKEPLFS